MESDWFLSTKNKIFSLQQMPTLLKISLFTCIEEHCLEEVYKGRSRLSKSGDKPIMDLIWFKVKKQLKRERVCIV
jgi:hypothetical protein